MDDDHIDFTAKYGKWVSIRRMTIHQDTKPEEVVYHLAGIRAAVEGKSFSFLGIDTAALDGYSLKLKGGAGKGGLGALASAIAKLEGSEAKGVISAAVPDKQLSKVAASYLLNRVISDFGYSTSVGQLELSKIYKHLKPPKMPRAKKAKG